MFKFILRNILYFFPLLLSVSCAMEDSDESTGQGTSGYYSGDYTNFMIKSVPAELYDAGGLYSNGGEYVNLITEDRTPKPPEFKEIADTASVFPNDTTFHDGIKDCITFSYGMAYKIINSLFNPKLQKETWMNFYEPYLGTYTSPLDSRVKQWEVIAGGTYLNKDYDYCLKISDMPGGYAKKDAVMDNAVEFFYNKDFTEGAAVFSPVNYDKIKYPENIFGKDIMCLLSFSAEKDSVINELIITDYSQDKTEVYGIDNVYLKFTEFRASGIVRFSGLIDLPRLWFDSLNNAGYCVCIAGTIDDNNKCIVFYTGLVRNDSAQTDVSALIKENPSGKVLNSLYTQWLKITSQEKTADMEFENPAYYNSHCYMGCGTADVSKGNVYQKAVNNTIEVLNGKFVISPYQNSIYKVLW